MKTELLVHWEKGKNLGYFSILDPHKHSDIIHFYMLNWKGEDLKFQRPIYLRPNLAGSFPLQWNFSCYLLLSIITSSSSSPVLLTFTCTCCFSHSRLHQGIPALGWNIWLLFRKILSKNPHLLWHVQARKWLITGLPKGIWGILYSKNSDGFF